MTGGTRLGIRMARPKCRAVNGITALSIAPSRTCRCQSSGLRMVMRAVMGDALVSPACGMWRGLPDRRCGRGVGLARRLVDHGAGKIGDAGKTASGAPLFQPLDDRDDARWIAENEV